MSDLTLTGTGTRNPKRVFVESHGRGEHSIFQRPRDGAYEVAYIGSNGKRRTVTLHGAKNISEARRAAKVVIGKRDVGEDVAPSNLTVDQLAQDFFASFEAKTKTGERSPRSLEDYKRRYRVHLEPRLGRVRAQALTRGHALRLLDELRASGAAPATISASWRTFVRIVNHGRDRGLLNVNIRLGDGERVKVRNARKVRQLTPEESALVVAAVSSPWKILVETAALTGARVSELLGLQWQDIDLATGTVSITKQLSRAGQLVPPKTENGTRTIRIGERLRLALLAHYNATEDKRPEAFVFGQHTQAAGRYRLAARALAKAIKDAGVEFDPEKERVSFHCFRHSVASQLVRSNIDPQRLADHLGDSVQVVIDTYVHSVETDNDENLGELLAVAG